MGRELLWLSVGAVVMAACGTVASPSSPAEVVDAQAAALARSDLAAAHALLTREAKALAPLWPPRERVVAVVDAVEVGRVARWSGGSEPLVVERTADGWRLRGGVLGLLRADTPEEALRSFGAALASSDYAAILHLIPESERGSWSVERLHDVFEAPAVRPRWVALAETLRGDGVDVTWLDPSRVSARVAGVTVSLVREAGGWKVFDVTPATDYTRP